MMTGNKAFTAGLSSTRHFLEGKGQQVALPAFNSIN